MPIQELHAFTSTSRVPCCSVCGNGPGKVNPFDPESRDRTVLGLGVDIDQEGTFDICWTCAVAIGDAAGMITEDKAESLRQEAAEYERRYTVTAEELAAVRGALAALREEARFHEKREADALAEGYAAGQGSGAGTGS